MMDDMDATIRRAVPDDLDAVVQVGRLTWPATYASIAGDEYVEMGLGKWWTHEATRPLVDSGRTFVAERPGDDGAREIVGIASTGLLSKDLVLFRLYVLPEHHGRGIGSQLLKAVLDDIARGSHTRLWLSYLVGNESARRFYARHGFVEQRREPGGHGIPDSVWVMLELPIDPEASP
ncbi:MAG: GNAT family N-acetyltransferase [Dermatophilaceae bacterium]